MTCLYQSVTFPAGHLLTVTGTRQGQYERFLTSMQAAHWTLLSSIWSPPSYTTQFRCGL